MKHTSSYVDNQYFLTILENHGYFPIFSKPKQILYNSIKSSLNMYSDYPVDSLFDCICSYSGISKEELLENHTHLKSLRQFFGEEAVDIIIDLFKKEETSSKYATTTNNINLVIKNILRDNCSKEIFEFITKILAHEHIIIIYKNENSIDTVRSKILVIENAQSESSLTKSPHVNTNVDKSQNLLLLLLLLKKLLKTPKE